jgi:uncharacterized integral membrane protein
LINRVLWLLIGFPVAVLLIALAVANRHDVRLVLDPFRPEAPVLSMDLPFYIYLFGALIVGVLLGGFATWLSQGQWRHRARVRAHEAARWQSEAERLSRERDSELSTRKQLVAVRR